MNNGIKKAPIKEKFSYTTSDNGTTKTVKFENMTVGGTYLLAIEGNNGSGSGWDSPGIKSKVNCTFSSIRYLQSYSGGFNMIFLYHLNPTKTYGSFTFSAGKYTQASCLKVHIGKE